MFDINVLMINGHAYTGWPSGGVLHRQTSGRKNHSSGFYLVTKSIVIVDDAFFCPHLIARCCETLNYRN